MGDVEMTLVEQKKREKSRELISARERERERERERVNFIITD